MKPFIRALLLGVLSAPAFAQQSSIPPSLLALQRSDWGCEVLLCLANPNGANAVAACRPPIERLYRDLARGHAFPSCSMATGPNRASYATPGSNPYDACPSGTTALEEGRPAMLASPMNAGPAPATYRSGSPSTYSQAATGFAYLGVGDGAFPMVSNTNDDAQPAKVCVAGLRGTQTVGSGESTYDVSLYDTIYVQQAQPSSRYIDVYIDNAVWQRVRW